MESRILFTISPPLFGQLTCALLQVYVINDLGLNNVCQRVHRNLVCFNKAFNRNRLKLTIGLKKPITTIFNLINEQQITTKFTHYKIIILPVLIKSQFSARLKKNDCLTVIFPNFSKHRVSLFYYITLLLTKVLDVSIVPNSKYI